MSEERNILADFRCGYIAIVGEPNVGKSTLMNVLLQQKISIVTPKAQTTRHKILGILSTQEFQAIFLDTPGIIKPKYLLQEVMMEFASSAIQDADVLLFMIDATKPGTDGSLAHTEAFAKVKGLNKPVFLVINKVDAVDKGGVLPVIDFYSKAFPFKEIFPISALKGDGTSELLAAVSALLPVHPPFYPLDIVSEHTERFFVSEIIREKIFLCTKEEIPYSTTVEIIEFKEREAGKTFISAEVYVERDSQKGILIGKKGMMLREIGAKSRKSIEEFLQHPVFLELHVKVQKEWRENASALARLGYKSS
ncbi:MAG: GTPase Era [Bacteroidetes bacterium]|nr:GTPase Era [Bacteroidota bacterium]MCW5894306.1 GTPase Era [Bacteroidota bacterium]